MDHLWQVLVKAAENETGDLSCEECFILMDYFADLLASGHAPREVLPLADRYLQRCPECQREYRQALADLVLVQREQLATR
jgi:hypothetical protein